MTEILHWYKRKPYNSSFSATLYSYNIRELRIQSCRTSLLYSLLLLTADQISLPGILLYWAYPFWAKLSAHLCASSVSSRLELSTGALCIRRILLWLSSTCCLTHVSSETDTCLGFVVSSVTNHDQKTNRWSPNWCHSITQTLTFK